MLAAVFEREGTLALRQVPVPKIEKDDQVLLKVDAVSICGTDVHILEVPPGYVATPNTILGHEFAGTVVEKGPAVSHLQVGDRVVVNPNDYCGVCVYCRKNLPNECANIAALGIHVNGAFAEFCRVSGKVAYKISKQVPVEQAACAEPLACVINGTQKVRLQPADTALVFGAGPIGMIMAMMYRACGASRVFIADKAPYRLDHAQKINLGRVIDVSKENVQDVVMAETGIGVDVAADTVGSQLVPAIDAARKGGKVLVFGVNTKAVSQLHQSEITFKELQVLGTWLANATFPEAVKILENRVLPIGDLVTHTISLSEVHRGLEVLSKGQAVKIIVKP